MLLKVSRKYGWHCNHTYLKFGFVLCCFMTSAERSRKTHTLSLLTFVVDFNWHSAPTVPRSHNYGICPEHKLLQESVNPSRQSAKGSSEERQCYQSTKLRLEALKEGCDRNKVEDHMEEVKVHQREQVETVHCAAIISFEVHTAHAHTFALSPWCFPGYHVLHVTIPKHTSSCRDCKLSPLSHITYAWRNIFEVIDNESAISCPKSREYLTYSGSDPS